MPTNILMPVLSPTIEVEAVDEGTVGTLFVPVESARDVPMPYAANLEKLALPKVDEVVQAAKSALYQ